MGCDIHTFTEVKIDGKWYTADQPDVSRWYTLFGKMAGVRDGIIEPISQPKGLPEDISVVARVEADYWGTDGHSHSWLSFDEVDKLFEWLGVEQKQQPYKTFGYATPDAFDKSLTPHYEDARLVFWFDN